MDGVLSIWYYKYEKMYFLVVLLFKSNVFANISKKLLVIMESCSRILPFYNKLQKYD